MTLHVGRVKWNYGTVLHGRAFASCRRELGQIFSSPETAPLCNSTQHQPTGSREAQFERVHELL